MVISLYDHLRFSIFYIYGGCMATINFVIFENLFHIISGWYFNC